MSESFYLKIYFVISILFLVGGIGLFWILPTEKRSKQLKIKFWVYLIIILIHILLIQFYIFGFQILSVLTLFIGLFEIHSLYSPVSKAQNQKKAVISEIFYLLICWCYFQFILMDSALILYTYLLVVSFDGFSQLAGTITGKNKMFERISPGKTWEGLAGGIIGSLIIVLLFRMDFSLFVENIFLKWILIIAFAFTGDVLASLLKRRAGIKDFSRLIPGHGGIIDRFDSLLIAGSAVYLWNEVLKL